MIPKLNTVYIKRSFQSCDCTSFPHCPSPVHKVYQKPNHTALQQNQRCYVAILTSSQMSRVCTLALQQPPYLFVFPEGAPPALGEQWKSCLWCGTESVSEGGGSEARPGISNRLAEAEGQPRPSRATSRAEEKDRARAHWKHSIHHRAALSRTDTVSLRDMCRHVLSATPCSSVVAAVLSKFGMFRMSEGKYALVYICTDVIIYSHSSLGL